jgi:rod shape determining protein RodA
MPKSFRPSFSLDWLSFGLMIVLMSLGLLFVFSATYTPSCPYSFFFKKQLAGCALGIILYWILVFIDYRFLVRAGYFTYFVVMGLLFFTLLKGSIGMGGQRWLNLFFFKIQPSELVKPLFPAFIAYYFFTHQKHHYGALRDFIVPFLLLGISFILIKQQPDLGTALTITFSGLILFWLAGMPRSFFIGSFIIIIIAAPILWHALKPYQRNRIMVFLGYGTAHKERYQIEQAAIAIGSGGLLGKGLLKGTQNQLQFLPESRTDCIFAVLCEEWGFVGALFVVSLYTLLFLRLLSLIRTFDEAYLQLLAIGLCIHLVLSTIINIFMVMGLLPIVGIPLPFMSYGLSNLLISCASMGWIQAIYVQQQ